MKTVAFATLGCKVNQYETQAMSELFAAAGYEVVSFESPADVYVVNTCTVTSLSDRKSRQMMRRAKRVNPDSVLAVTGCYAQTAPEAVRGIAGVDLVVGTSRRGEIVSLAEQAMAGKRQCCVEEIAHARAFEPLTVSGHAERVRGYVKVQEGCNQFCSYCIIPYARGPVRSRSMEDAVAEAARLAEAGLPELVLTGIHIASYGRESGQGGLTELIRRIDAIDTVRRIRLSSIEPMTLDASFLSSVADAQKLCPHFHLSLQSGCDDTLRRMNRKYSTDQYRSIVEGLRRAFPDAALTTDVMVGFPGEDAREFEASLQFIQSIGFADIHIFPYSPRNGTPAADMAGQVAPDEKQRRSGAVAAVRRESRAAFLRAHLGRTLPVLFEQESEPGLYEGKTANYIPVRCRAERGVVGELIDVVLEGTDGEQMTGRMV